jgi:hypothetical protein
MTTQSRGWGAPHETSTLKEIIEARSGINSAGVAEWLMRGQLVRQRIGSATRDQVTSQPVTFGSRGFESYPRRLIQKKACPGEYELTIGFTAVSWVNS